VWVGDVDEGLGYLSTIRELGKPASERVMEMSYVELQCRATTRTAMATAVTRKGTT